MWGWRNVGGGVQLRCQLVCWGRMAILQRLAVDEALLEEFCRRSKVVKLELFGSTVADPANARDVDLLVTFAADANWGLFEHEGMQRELAELLGRNVDLVSRRAIEASGNALRRSAILDSVVTVYVAGYNMIDKDRSREIRRHIRRVLMTEWDPIGVRDVPQASDEYDSYIGGFYELLKRGASEAEIGDCLRWIEVDQMGLTDASGNPLVPAATRSAVAASLKDLGRDLTDTAE